MKFRANLSIFAAFTFVICGQASASAKLPTAPPGQAIQKYAAPCQSPIDNYAIDCETNSIPGAPNDAAPYAVYRVQTCAVSGGSYTRIEYRFVKQPNGNWKLQYRHVELHVASCQLEE